MTAIPPDIPGSLRGRLTPDRPLGDLTWLRVGGPADWLCQPADRDDLAVFLASLPAEIPVFAMGVGSNLIVRDGGVRGVVIRLGRGFNSVTVEADGRDLRGARRRSTRRWRGLAAARCGYTDHSFAHHSGAPSEVAGRQ